MTTEHELEEEEGFAAPTDAVTIVLSRTRYEQLKSTLAEAVERTPLGSELLDQRLDLFALILTQEGK
jgi:hypothetical protein